MYLAEVWSHVFPGGELSVPQLIPELPLQLLNRSRRPQAAKTVHHQEDGEAKKPARKSAAATKAATVELNKKASASVKTVAAKLTTNNLAVTPQPPISAL
jgi:hypothetical protein